MVTKSRFKKLDDKGIQTFTVKKEVTIPLMTSVQSVAGTTQTYREGATVQGELVKVQALVKKGSKFVPLGEADGVQVMSDQGYYLVPIDCITWNSDTWNADTVTDTTETVAQIKAKEEPQQIPVFTKETNEKKILGFTYTQIAVVAGLVFIVNRLMK